MTTNYLDEPAKAVGDVTGIAITAGAFVGMLPDIAAFLSVVWLVIRIYECATVQNWLAKRRSQKSK